MNLAKSVRCAGALPPLRWCWSTAGLLSGLWAVMACSPEDEYFYGTEGGPCGDADFECGDGDALSIYSTPSCSECHTRAYDKENGKLLVCQSDGTFRATDEHCAQGYVRCVDGDRMQVGCWDEEGNDLIDGHKPPPK